ncbi:MAG: DUF2157 domain-containing protein [Colwellia sp.]|nr:DUF2157 domain-containing protein [Colwellia sp.]
MESFRAELINFIEDNSVAQKDIDEVVKLSKIKPSSQAWQVFINTVFLSIGSVALGLSCIFFLAYNWSDFGRFAKFALVETALVVSLIVYVKAQAGSMVSSATLLCSTLLLGALMALVGQTYQTGADPWQLFFYWAVLMLPWALIARFTTIWLIWLVLLNLSIGLYCEVYLNPLSLLLDHKVSVIWLIFVVNTLSLVVWHKLSPSRPWMQKPWAIRIIGLSVGMQITSLAFSAIVNDKITETLALPIWAVCLVLFYLFYRKVSFDLFMLAGICLSGSIITITLFAEKIIDFNEIAGFLLLGICTIGLGILSAFWLKKVQVETQL